MARLIRTEKEVEGRFEEVWLVVEEDPLEQWPAGPRAVVGRPATRQYGLERVRGEARFTADISLPGMLHAAFLRSPHAHARVRRIDLAPALAIPGVRAAIGPGEAQGLVDEAGFAGAPVAAVAADTFGQALAAMARSRSSGRSSRSCSIRTTPSGASSSPPSRAVTSAATSTARSPRPTSSSRARIARSPSSTTRSRRTRRSASGRRHPQRLHLDAVHLGRARRGRRRARMPPDKVRVVCEFMGGGFGSKNGPDEYTFVAAELAKRTGRPVRCALTRREEHTAAGNRNATIQRLRAAARSDGTIVALDGEFTNAVGWSGWNSSDRRPDADALRLRERPHRHPRREDQHAADEGVPRARLRRRDVRPRVPSRRARRQARHRSARAPPPQLRGSNEGRRSPRRTSQTATGLPRRTGSGATRFARGRTPCGSAASAWRARSGTAAAALPPTRGCGSAPTAAPP